MDVYNKLFMLLVQKYDNRDSDKFISTPKWRAAQEKNECLEILADDHPENNTKQFNR